ncbi:Uracil phosphoribosyltransferase [Desulfarculus baarsii DSM 2075]|uniref:Bifunctional protein PyrR n=1 Tax=Desulfarculus baarsii (strain ATCC 33931 / DSM 2075 / LMG 7858 / VKM B-1802 / 2st14) TaxID=644282 RepID=E1QFK1_DESB2|nr:bifunctional pyr operon transcriptional regulator/uracil phosphoribosyltransferase PyrR [Desulfarculus baarsii]ADK84337.1 Uracil phosphoribosyltransferase [Desulfarculus baarsii DSM 2075]
MPASRSEIVLTAPQIARMIAALTSAIQAGSPAPAELCLVAIRRGGEELATRLAHGLARATGAPPKIGAIDITLYRDDWTMRTDRPVVRRTDITFPVDDREIILVDDVLFTGRTVRAALDELMDFGRPRVARLAVLVDRGGRELPIQPDYVGQTIACAKGERIDVLLGGTPGDDRVVRQRQAGAGLAGL